MGQPPSRSVSSRRILRVAMVSAGDKAVFKIFAGRRQEERRVVLCQEGARLFKSYLHWQNRRRRPVELPYTSFEEAIEKDSELQALEHEFDAKLVDPPLGKSEFYARMARNDPEEELNFFQKSALIRSNFYIDGFPKAWLSVNVAASHLFAELEEIFRVVEPAPRNAHAFGHRLRHVLVLACTEIEACWKGILRANGYKKERLNTSDYVKLKAPMGLEHWGATLESYQEFGEWKPFADWDPCRPTQSLGWYDAYNAVKHDREEKLDLATLGNVLSACAALTIMVHAQFGREARLYAIPRTTTFIMSSKIQWEPHELYFGEGPWTPKPYDFGGGGI